MDTTQEYVGMAEDFARRAMEADPDSSDGRSAEAYFQRAAQVQATLAVAAAVAELTERLGAQIVHELRS